ncbi:MAG: hypothetical protein O6913_04265, partial [Chloroflexi bacterium]|nr:hypothetical protein [Chloroflexota bacterium]
MSRRSQGNNRAQGSRGGSGGRGQRTSTRLAVRQRRRRRERQTRKGFPKLWIFGPMSIFIVLLITAGAGAGAVYGVYRSFANDLVEPTDIELTQRSLGTSKVFDREGESGRLLFEFADPLSGL